MNKTATIAVHTVVNAAMKVAQGQSALSGAATGEIVGMLAIEIYQKPVDKLSEKQTV